LCWWARAVARSMKPPQSRPRRLAPRSELQLRTGALKFGGSSRVAVHSTTISLRYGPSTAKGASDEDGVARGKKSAREGRRDQEASMIRVPTIVRAYPGFVAALELPMAS
jgi:hypothetical protein